MKKIRLRVVRKWCLQILEGLLYLHSKDPPLIHRDLKCENIFIKGETGDIKIADFGLSTQVARDVDKTYVKCHYSLRSHVLSLSISFSLSSHESINLSIYPSINQSIYLSIYLSRSQNMYLDQSMYVPDPIIFHAHEIDYPLLSIDLHFADLQV